MTDLKNLPAIDQVAPKFVAMLEKIVVPIIGMEMVEKVWQEIYMYNGDGYPLIYQEEGNWVVWGDKDENGYSFLLAHMILVAAGLAVGGGGQIEVLAGLSHDGYKRMDIALKDSAGGHEEFYLRAESLFGTDVARTAEYSGHTSMPNVISDIANGELHWPSLLFFLVDGCAVRDGFQTVGDKIDYLEAHLDRYPYNDEGIAVWGHPYFTFQRHLSETLQAAAAERIGVKVPTDFANTLNRLIEKALA